MLVLHLGSGCYTNKDGIIKGGRKEQKDYTKHVRRKLNKGRNSADPRLYPLLNRHNVFIPGWNCSAFDNRFYICPTHHRQGSSIQTLVVHE
ncbi:hypothetical protein LENED_004141 [Lentinula edodes]|uniref:Uncharacterized protein n=1 Tax=Lentinula edodes TaxID=5353 RepID=A0A1Q3E5G8_LENED|nr:hypothetical protein LENED_004141 [Lentinula edodes]